MKISLKKVHSFAQNGDKKFTVLGENGVKMVEIVNGFGPFTTTLKGICKAIAGKNQLKPILAHMSSYISCWWAVGYTSRPKSEWKTHHITYIHTWVMHAQPQFFLLGLRNYILN